MAIEPGIYNFTLQRRSDHTIPLIFKDSNNAAINLTGFTVAAQVWEETRTTKYADFSVTYTDRSAGSVSITLTPDILKYDVLLVNGAGAKEYYLEGTIFVSEGYTST
jgi:hypothetical protein